MLGTSVLKGYQVEALEAVCLSKCDTMVCVPTGSRKSTVSKAIFRCFLLSHFNYCALPWHFCGMKNTKELEKVQCRALQFVFQDFSSTYEALLETAAREKMIVVEIFKSMHHLSPKFKWDMFQPKSFTM